MLRGGVHRNVKISDRTPRNLVVGGIGVTTGTLNIGKGVGPSLDFANKEVAEEFLNLFGGALGLGDDAADKFKMRDQPQTKK